MISFSEYGPPAPPPRPCLPLRPGLIRLRQQWVGAALLPPALVPAAGLRLSPDGAHFIFTARMKPGEQDRKKVSADPFVEGLWKRNVVELFLASPTSGRYLEIHLAPCFAWWSCFFSDIRQREQPHGRPLPLAVIQHRTSRNNSLWQATVQLDAPLICRMLDVPGPIALRGNFAAVVMPVTGPASYFSYVTMPGPTPDFHQPAAWLPLG